jgi:hypothetical protein
MSVVTDILVQVFCYAIIIVLSFFCFSVLLKGFLWNYIKVRSSFGKYVLLKIKAINRDYYAVGKIEGEFLIFNINKEERRIKINSSRDIYRCLSVGCLDIDESKNCIISSNAESVAGFDAVKYNELYLRALYKPVIMDKKDQLILLLVIGIGLCCLITIYLTYMNYSHITTLMKTVMPVGA